MLINLSLRGWYFLDEFLSKMVQTQKALMDRGLAQSPHLQPQDAPEGFWTSRQLSLPCTFSLGKQRGFKARALFKGQRQRSGLGFLAVHGRDYFSILS